MTDLIPHLPRLKAIARAGCALAAALGAILLAALPAKSEEAPQGAPPAVTEAIAASPAPQGPAQVAVGAYINDIQELDFKANNYVVDLYVWFRWRGSELDPAKTMEFMNRVASDDNLREIIYDEPKAMPDGSLYSVIRYQGRFSTKFDLGKYPFDTQLLTVLMEDTVSGNEALTFVPDGDHPAMIDPVITLPGFHVGAPAMSVAGNTYPTNFGDLAEPEAETYSRVAVTVPVTRPVVAMSLKTFVPIALIVVCASLVFFVRPRYVEGRIGLGITALLTLVALQLTASAALPDVDYLMMLDKIYLLAYLFIIVTLARVVATSWRGGDAESEAAVARADRVWAIVLLAIFLAANLAVAGPALASL
ncbi:MAG: hypothetical protein AB7V40_06425 [Methyloceanibacter sp.]